MMLNDCLKCSQFFLKKLHVGPQGIARNRYVNMFWRTYHQLSEKSTRDHMANELDWSSVIILSTAFETATCLVATVRDLQNYQLDSHFAHT